MKYVDYQGTIFWCLLVFKCLVFIILHYCVHFVLITKSLWSRGALPFALSWLLFLVFFWNRFWAPLIPMLLKVAYGSLCVTKSMVILVDWLDPQYFFIQGFPVLYCSFLRLLILILIWFCRFITSRTSVNPSHCHLLLVHGNLMDLKPSPILMLNVINLARLEALYLKLWREFLPNCTSEFWNQLVELF